MSNPFVIIYGHVLLRDGLTIGTKLVHGLIVGLSSKSGLCWASNAYMAKCLGVSESSITRGIAALESASLIKVETETTDKKTRRKIYPVHNPVDNLLVTKEGGSQNDEGGSSNCRGGVVKMTTNNKEDNKDDKYIYKIGTYHEEREEFEEHLEPLTDAILGDNRWVATQKRPMKKYPKIWVSYKDLDTLFEAFEQYGLPEDEFNAPFRIVQQRLQDKPSNGFGTVDAVNWLLGFGLKDALDLSIKKGVKNGQKNKR